MPERCPKCGAPMCEEWSRELDENLEPIAYQVCSADRRDCRIVELERQLEVELHRVTCAGVHGHNPQILDCPKCVEVDRDEARAKLDGALAQVGMLGWISVHDHCPAMDTGERVLIYTEGYDFQGEQFFDVKADDFYGDEDDLKEIIKCASHWRPLDYPGTSATAQQFVARIEREALEKAWERGEKRLRDKGCTDDLSRLRMAFLGTHAALAPSNTTQKES